MSREEPSAPTFTHRTLPVVGKRVCRLGLAPSFGIDAAGVEAALGEHGINYVYWTPRMGRSTSALRAALREDREHFVVATGPLTAWWGGNLLRFVDRARRVLDTDYLDVLQMHWLGVTSAWTTGTAAAMASLREAGVVRALGVSIHDRRRAGSLAADSLLDLLMIRYNAAHPGAEKDIFPHLEPGRRAVVAYTATDWRRLLKPRRGWDGAIPTAGHCYRFCLTDPHVDVVLTGPKNAAQLAENTAALDRGPLDPDEMEWLRAFGRAVHG